VSLRVKHHLYLHEDVYTIVVVRSTMTRLNIPNQESNHRPSTLGANIRPIALTSRLAKKQLIMQTEKQITQNLRQKFQGLINYWWIMRIMHIAFALLISIYWNAMCI